MELVPTVVGVFSPQEALNEAVAVHLLQVARLSKAK